MKSFKDIFSGRAVWVVIVVVLVLALAGEVAFLVKGSSLTKKSSVAKVTTNTTKTAPVTKNTNTAAIPEANTNATSSGPGWSGSYSCISFYVNGQPGPNGCAWQPQLVLFPDGSYTFSLEKGTYSISGNQMILSKSDFRGPAEILLNGFQLRFNYRIEADEFTVTYGLDGVTFEEETANTNTEEEGTTIPFVNETPDDQNLNSQSSTNSPKSDETNVPATNSIEAEPCDPLVPLYAQPDCIDEEE